MDAGVDIVQLREGDLDAGLLYELASGLVSLARGSRTRVLVNDRVDVAIAAGAGGVHLKAASIATAAVRRIAPAGFLIGRSVHDADEAARESQAADYLLAGTVWPTRSKPAGHRTLGADGLAAIVRAARVPVLAIGGIGVERLPEVARAGAAGVAAIGLFIPADTSADTPGTGGVRSLHDLALRVRQAFDEAVPPTRQT